MIPFLGLGAFALYGILCYYIITHRTERRSGTTVELSKKRIKNLRKKVSERETRKRLTRIRAVAELMRLIPLIGYSKERESEIRELLAATDKRDSEGRLMIPEEIYIQQLIVAGVVIGTAAVIGVFTTPFLVIAAIPISTFAMKIPLTSLQDEQIAISAEISSQFLEFYKVYHVQFIRKEVTSTLNTVVSGFIPQASDGFKKVLSRFLSDLDAGEEFALTQLDNRYYTNPKIHKFVMIAKSRSRGEEACFDNMRAFLAEMEDQREAFYDDELEKRSLLISRIIMAYLMTMVAFIFGTIIASMVVGSI